VGTEAYAVTVESLSVVLDGNTVFQDMSFLVPRGAVVLLLGANGIGKSTLLRCLARLLPQRSGRINAGSNIGYVGHESMCYAELTTEENLEFFMDLEGIKTQDKLNEILDTWNLQKYRKTLFAELSKGVMNRVSMARAFWKQRNLILLDEPTASLDDKSTQLLKEQIRNFVSPTGREGAILGSVIVSTHDIARLKDVATHSLIMYGASALKSYGLSEVHSGIKKYQELNR